ncbi:unnamed protein product, partial [Mesorhabditis spiculigera]
MTGKAMAPMGSHFADLDYEMDASDEPAPFLLPTAAEVVELRKARNEEADVQMETSEEMRTIILNRCDVFFEWVLNCEIAWLDSTDAGAPSFSRFPHRLPQTLFTGIESEPEACLELYALGKSVEEIAESRFLDKRRVLMGIILKIWEDRNSKEVSLETIIAHVDVDVAMIAECKNYLGRRGDSKVSPPCLVENVFITPLGLAFVLLVVKAEMEQWPLDIDWQAVSYHEMSESEVRLVCWRAYLMMFFSWALFLKKAVNISSLRISLPLPALMRKLGELLAAGRTLQFRKLAITAEEEKNAHASLRYAFNKSMQELEKMNSELTALAEISANAQRAVIHRMEMAGDELGPPSTPSERQQNEKEIRRVNQERSHLAVFDQEGAKATLTSLRELAIGQTVLARREPRDGCPFETAVVDEIRLPLHSYLINFGDGNRQVIEVADLALNQPGVHTLFSEGLRVCAKITHPYARAPSKRDRVENYYSGVISNRPGRDHKMQFLIFFDDDFDEYVSGADIQPMCCQPISNGVLDKMMASSFIRQNQKKREFVDMYFKSYPEWNLASFKKTDIHKRLACRTRNRDRWSAILLAIDRHMCTLRFPPLERTMGVGANCVASPCHAHFHTDERIYRGSNRLLIVEQGLLPDPGRHRHLNMLENAVPTTATFSGTEKTKRVMTSRKTTHGNATGPIGTSKEAAASRELEIKKKNQAKLIYETLTPSTSATTQLCPHTCDADCLQVSADLPETLAGLSPFYIPLLFGWRREKVVRWPKSVKTGGRGRQRKPEYSIQYTAPCGRSMRRIEDIATFLRLTGAELTIDNFTYDINVRESYMAKADPQYQVMADFSLGVEQYAIPAINSVDDEPVPKIKYSGERFAENDAVVITTLNREWCSGCTCTGDCADSERCECRILTQESVERLAAGIRPQDPKNRGYDHRRLYDVIYSGIYECNQFCGCSRKICHNRVAQQPIMVPLHLFRTAECGWGVRTLCDLPEGTFICNYAGAILSDTLAEELKRGDEYYADLDLIDTVDDLKLNGGIDFLEDLGMADLGGQEADGRADDAPSVDSDGYQSGDNSPEGGGRKRQRIDGSVPPEQPEQPADVAPASAPADAVRGWDRDRIEKYFGDDFLFITDAKERGNIGRFLNHCCDPNVRTQFTFIETHDLRLPSISFYTKSFIKAGEELRMDYNYETDVAKPMRIACCCGAQNCRRRLL